MIGLNDLLVTNAFRLGFHLGPSMTNSRKVKSAGWVTNAFRLGVHLGPKSGKSTENKESGVTNAFRLGVHLGRSKWLRLYDAFRLCHQCLSAGGPLGTWQPDVSDTCLKCEVTNAFRLGVHLGQMSVVELRYNLALSPMPFGWGFTWDRKNSEKDWSGLAFVTNAFRLGVHLGRSIQ